LLLLLLLLLLRPPLLPGLQAWTLQAGWQPPPPPLLLQGWCPQAGWQQLLPLLLMILGLRSPQLLVLQLPMLPPPPHLQLL